VVAWVVPAALRQAARVQRANQACGRAAHEDDSAPERRGACRSAAGTTYTEVPVGDWRRAEDCAPDPYAAARRGRARHSVRAAGRTAFQGCNKFWLRTRGHGLCLPCGLAGNSSIGDCDVDGSRIFVEPVASAKVQLPTQHSLRVRRIVERIDSRAVHRLSRAQRRASADRCQNEIKRMLAQTPTVRYSLELNRDVQS